MKKEPQVGDSVIFIDSHRVEHQALVTNVFGAWQDGYSGCNVVYTSSDESKQDPYGRQLERATSICHVSVNPARAYCWRNVDES